MPASGVLDGRVRLEPASVHLGQSHQSLVAVEGIELARLFEVYPAEGLSAAAPGRALPGESGERRCWSKRAACNSPARRVLRYQAQQLRDMAASNPNLEQLAAALDDFRYRAGQRCGL